MSNVRALTEEEKRAVEQEGLDPDLFSVRYTCETQLHLLNHISGSDIIIYWGDKHRAGH